MATRYHQHFATAQHRAVEEGIPAGIVESRIQRFASIFAVNAAIPEQLESAGLLASACNRIALGAKFDRNEIDQRLAREPSDQSLTDVKICLMNLGLME